MDELDHYWKTEYLDGDFRRYEAAQGPKPKLQDPEVLARGDVRTWTIRGRPSVLVCLEGRLWLTRSGSSRDLVLGPGDTVIMTKGLWVVQALELSRFHTGEPHANQEVQDGTTGLFSLFRRLRGPELCRT